MALGRAIAFACVGVMSLLVASCKETREGDCSTSKAPRLPAEVLAQLADELPDPCMAIWVRRGFSLGEYMPTEKVRRFAEDRFHEMVSASPYAYQIHSGFRSYHSQKATFARWAEREKKKDPSIGQAEAERRANTYSAHPGESEHQLGTVFDIGYAELHTFNLPNGSPFAKSCAGKWLRENAHRFGFTMSYPYGKESLTCFVPEPWHWRYVGKTLATHLRENDLTLEEYFRRITGVEPASTGCPVTNSALAYEVDPCTTDDP
jgi:LAS superfamily LD-carboxypeptidase LdcB